MSYQEVSNPTNFIPNMTYRYFILGDASRISEESHHRQISRKEFLKLIGVSEENVETNVVNRFSNNLCLQDSVDKNFSDNYECVSDEKSLFKNINEKYECFLNDSLKSENDCSMDLIENTDVRKYFDNKMEQFEESDIWEDHSKDVLDHNKAKGKRFLIN